MQRFKIRTILIFFVGVAAAGLLVASAANTQAEPVKKHTIGKHTAATTLAMFPADHSVASTNALGNETTSSSFVAKRGYAHAAVTFPGFCHEWEQKLRDRELNNRAHIRWDTHDKLKVGNYVGYSAVQTCECKEATNGLPIGKLTYQEFNYHVSGKTVGAANQAKPTVVHTTNTLEIFSWDRERWFY
jgi:hypothetical protein